MRSHPLVGPGLSGMVAADRYTTATHPPCHPGPTCCVDDVHPSCGYSGTSMEAAARIQVHVLGSSSQKAHSSNRGKTVHHDRAHAGIVVGQAVMLTQSH